MTADTSRDFNSAYLKMVPFLSLGFFLIFKFIGPAISRRMVSFYTSLTGEVKIEWDARLMSTTNATVTAILAAYSLSYGEGMNQHNLWVKNFEAALATTLVLSYMIADTFIMYGIQNPRLSDKIVYSIHHFVGLHGGIVMPGYSFVLYYAMLRTLMEFSTPFVNIRWCLETAGYARSHPLVLINGTMMLLTFFVFRMLSMPYFWYMVLQHMDEFIASVHGIYILIPCVAWDFFNCFWFYKIVRGYIKAVNNFVKPKSEGKKD